MLYGAAAIGTGVGAAWRWIDFRTNLKRVDLSFGCIKDRFPITVNFACKNCVCEVCED